MDRDQFLATARAAGARGLLPAVPAPASIPAADEVDLVALFRERATAVNATVHGPHPAAGVPHSVAEIVSGHGSETFLSWDDLPVAGVPSSLGAAGCRRLPHHVEEDERLDHQLGYRYLSCGITGAEAGLAESGSVVLTHGPGRPRMASLVPEIHIALLPSDRIHRSLAHWAREQPEMVDSTANLVIVSGPSRTGDIELQLNLGVHGPRIVHIVLIEP